MEINIVASITISRVCIFRADGSFKSINEINETVIFNNYCFGKRTICPCLPENGLRLLFTGTSEREFRTDSRDSYRVKCDAKIITGDNVRNTRGREFSSFLH